MKAYWGTMELWAEDINMPPPERNIEEMGLVPAPDVGFVPAEIRAFSISGLIQLNNKPIIGESEHVESLGGTVYTRGIDYAVDNLEGRLNRLPGGAIGIEETVVITYSYANILPSSTISTFGRKRRRVTVDGWTDYAKWNEIEYDIEQGSKKILTLPNGRTYLMFISSAPRATRKRGLDRVFYTLEFLEV